MPKMLSEANGWFLTLLAFISGSGPVISVVLSIRAKNNLDKSAANVNESTVDVNKSTAAELSQKAIALDEDREAKREERFLKREEHLEEEINELRGDIIELRSEIGALMAYIVEDENWHFNDDRERRQKGEPLKPSWQTQPTPCGLQPRPR